METEAELKKLTVAQLKTKCKERRIQGYSKLAKDALIQKLLGQTSPQVPTPETSNPLPSPPALSETSNDDSAFKVPALPGKVLQMPSSSAQSSTSPLASTTEPAKKKKKKGSAVDTAPSVDSSAAHPSEPLKKNKKTSTVESAAVAPSTASIDGAQQPALPESAKKKKKTRVAVPTDSSTSASSIEPPEEKRTENAVDATPGTSTDGTAAELSLSASTTKPAKTKKKKMSDAKTTPVDSPLPPLASTTAPPKKRKKTSAVDTTTTPIESSTSKDAPEPPKKKKKTSPVESSVSSSAPSASEPPKKKKKPTTSTNVPAGDADPPRPVERSTNSATVTATVQTERTSTPNPLKRPSSSVLTTDTAPPPPKKPKVPFLLPTTVPKTTLPRVVIRPVVDSTPPLLQDGVKLAKPKRFIPLKVISSKNPSTSTPSIQPPAPTMTVAPAREVLFYLEFPCSLEPPTMAPVSLPPSISQRKRVPRLALILSFLVNYLERKDLDQCVLVSRMFRYAVYLSAYHHLLRHFKGDRLVQVLSKHPDASRTTNMWPYLSQRLNEVSIRKKFFVQSFLGALFPTRAISERIWMSPDHERQLIVAIRFILTRHFFKVSIGDGKLQGGPGWREGQIIDAQQLVPNQVWKITISHSRKETESFFVLEQTCEPLAAPTGSQNSGFSVRVDWSAYITECTQSNHSSIQPLITRLNWTNHEEYDRGISRLWLKRMDEAGKMGFVKRLTAERYILACVVGNSLSGRWMSSTQMALEHRGLPEEVAIAKPTVNFFLPAHHHVESVHFTATGPRKGQLLHGALAVIQTPGREYFILRDNGMQVGCEEDGVAEVWMKMLRCDSWGVALD